jgi:Flp pilus assembly protein TadB
MNDVEVDIRTDGTKAVIEGKTSVPFRTFVSLILQRKVQTLFKTSQDEPVIVSSELLTKLASAPNDRQEDRSKLVLVTFGMGVLSGLFLFALLFLGLSMLAVRPTDKDLWTVVGVFAAVGIVLWVLLRAQRTAGKQRLYESMEKMTDLITR